MTHSDTLLPNLILLVTLSTSVLSLSYDAPDILPKEEINYSYEIAMPDLKDSAFNEIPSLSLNNDTYGEINTIVEFSKKLISNSIDIDSEFVDIVNEHFWDLI